jgi:Zn-dependent M28 family amino/carboxypeptidase
MTERYISGTFKKLGLKPFESSTFTHSFPYYKYSNDKDGIIKCDTVTVRNVVALLPATFYSTKYIVVCANYDGIGKLGSTIYNGADDNASGLASMLAIAKMMTAFAKDEQNLNTNILFIAFDGAELDMAGSKHFVSYMDVSPSDIKCVVDMDRIGTSLEPPTDNPAYLIVLCNSQVPSTYKSILRRIDLNRNMNLCLDFSYYGSEEFTKLFFASADHIQFSKKGIPAMMFTSGINKYTLKPNDDPNIIDYTALSSRIMLIFSFLLWLQD